jgi:hypothetical protein
VGAQRQHPRQEVERWFNVDHAALGAPWPKPVLGAKSGVSNTPVRGDSAKSWIDGSIWCGFSGHSVQRVSPGWSRTNRLSGLCYCSPPRRRKRPGMTSARRFYYELGESQFGRTYAVRRRRLRKFGREPDSVAGFRIWQVPLARIDRVVVIHLGPGRVRSNHSAAKRLWPVGSPNS